MGQKLSRFINRSGWPLVMFGLLGSIFGLAMMVVTPPYEVPDEPTHFFRAYQVTQLDPIADHIAGGRVGGNLPAGIPESVRQTLGQIPNHLDQRVDGSKIRRWLRQEPGASLEPVGFENTALYSPVAYLPQALGIAAVRLAGGSVLAMMYAGRLLNLLAWLILVGAAIKLIPIGKWATAAVGLLPISLFLAGSLSADVVTAGLAILLVALIVRFAYQPRIVSRTAALGLMVISVLLALTKQPYWLLSILVLIIPAERWGSRARQLKWAAAVIGASLIAIAIWTLATRSIYIPYRPGFDIRPGAQAKLVALHPLGYAKVLVHTYAGPLGVPILVGLIGLLGWLDVSLPLWVIIGGFSLLVLAALYDPEPGPAGLPKSAKWLVALAAFGLLVAISSLLYLSYNSVGAPQIEGLQARYFIPLLALSGPLFYRGRLRLTGSESVLAAVMIIGFSAILIASLLAIFHRFYG